MECIAFFAENAVDAPHSASCEALSNYSGTITDLKNQVISEVVVKGGNVDEWMDFYADAAADMVAEILEQLNQQSF